VGASGKAFTVTVISALGLSQPIVWLTQYEVLPDAAVEGVGAVALPVPPVATVYHNSPAPVAVRGAAVAPWQYVTGVVTVGASGKAFTIREVVAVLEQLPLVTVYSTVTVPAVRPVTTPPGLVMLAVPVPATIDQTPPAVASVKAGVVALTQTVAAPPAIGATVIGAGWVTVRVPVAGVQFLASVTLHA
jgi:hypothetical protein